MIPLRSHWLRRTDCHFVVNQKKKSVFVQGRELRDEHLKELHAWLSKYLAYKGATKKTATLQELKVMARHLEKGIGDQIK